jgi:hypothetical protein
MSSHTSTVPAPRWSFRLSLDGWAVALAFAVAALVRCGILKRIPW